jgi:hypothetical protein
VCLVLETFIIFFAIYYLARLRDEENCSNAKPLLIILIVLYILNFIPELSIAHLKLKYQVYFHQTNKYIFKKRIA